MRAKEHKLESCSVLHAPSLTCTSKAQRKEGVAINSPNIIRNKLSSYGITPTIMERDLQEKEKGEPKKMDEPLLITPENTKRRRTTATTSSTTRSSFIVSTETKHPNLTESWEGGCCINPAMESVSDPAYMSLGSYSCYYSNVWNPVRNNCSESVCLPRNCLNQSYCERLKKGKRSLLDRSGCEQVLAYRGGKFSSPKVVRALRGDYVLNGATKSCVTTAKPRRVSPLAKMVEEIKRIYKANATKRRVRLNLLLDNMACADRKFQENREHKSESTALVCHAKKIKGRQGQKYIRNTNTKIVV